MVRRSAISLVLIICKVRVSFHYIHLSFHYLSLQLNKFDLNQFSGQQQYDDRELYFHALASVTENAVPLSVLNNETQWLRSADSTPRSFREIGTRQSQSAAQAIDSNGNVFFGLMTPIALACWDSERPYTQENIHIVAQNDATLQFASGVKVIRNRKGKEELWVLTCRFQRVMAQTINQNEINFRIQALQIDELLDGNKCGRSGGSSVGGPSNGRPAVGGGGGGGSGGYHHGHAGYNYRPGGTY